MPFETKKLLISIKFQ